MWTSLIQYADYVWLAVRTNPEAKKHRGISMLIVPTDAPGFSRRCTRWPAWTPAPPTTRTSGSPPTNLVGEENGGWKLVTNQLNHERRAGVGPTDLRGAQRGSRMRRTPRTCTVTADRLRVGKLNLARVHAKAEVLKLISWPHRGAAWPSTSSDEASPSPADASAAKVFGTELATEAYRLLMEVLAPRPPCARIRPARCCADGSSGCTGQLPDPDLRRRHQRDPARHHRHGRARPAQSEPLGHTWISRRPKPPRISAVCARSPSRCTRAPARTRRPRAGAPPASRGTPVGDGSTATCGAS